MWKKKRNDHNRWLYRRRLNEKKKTLPVLSGKFRDVILCAFISHEYVRPTCSPLLEINRLLDNVLMTDALDRLGQRRRRNMRIVTSPIICHGKYRLS